MTEIIHLIKELGSSAIDFFWLPVTIWTGLALVAAVLLKRFSSLSVIYQYHFRVAVLTALPAGVLTAPLIHALMQSSEAVAAASPLFVIQNPITVTPAAQTGFNWADPALWIGVLTVIAASIALTALAKLIINHLQLRFFIQKLNETESYSLGEYSDVSVFLSDDISVPCTFGRFKKRIIMPKELKNEPKKYNMALRHELIHIKNRDYAINNFTEVIRALFYFHPLVHYFIKQANEYREMYCDISLLTDADISQKSYAKLLCELAPKPLFKNATAVSMAVNPSTLKKRIQTMKTQTNISPSLKRSVIVTLLLGLTLTGFMACSDITDDGLTVAEVEKMQQKAAEGPIVIYEGSDSPLWVLNGEVLENDEKAKLERLKPKYIKSIEVLKGEAAIEAYGEAGKNGVIKIKVYNKDRALSDLQSPLPPQNGASAGIDAAGPPPPPQKVKKVIAVYLSVEDMPQFKNRKEVYSHVKYPEKCRKAGNEGKVLVQFTVTKTGKLNRFEVIKGIGEACDNAALKVVKKYAEFTPGTQNEEPVNVRVTIPIEYRLSNSSNKK